MIASVFCYTLAKWLIKLVLFFCYLEPQSRDLLCFDHLIIQYLACSLTPSQINQINLAGSGHLCLRVFKNLSLEQHKIKQCYGYIFIIKQQSQCLPGVFSYTVQALSLSRCHATQGCLATTTTTVISKITILHIEHTFLVHCFAIRVRPLCAMFSGRRSLDLNLVPKHSTAGKFTYIWHFTRVVINTTKF